MVPYEVYQTLPDIRYNCAQRMKRALMQFADSAGQDQQADLGLHCPLRESMDTVIYLYEQRLSRSDCIESHFPTLYINILNRALFLSGKSCYEAIDLTTLEERVNMTELPKENLDLILLANLQQNRVNSAHTQQTSTHKEEKDRQRASVVVLKWYTSERPRIFKLFLHGIQV